jgi:signal transduction histidine kinase
LPVTIAGEERWLSAVAVDFGEGRVYALRDVTHERRLEEARADFVTTASHELRTPLAAVYGAVRTLRRRDVVLDPQDTEEFLEIIESETERLSTIVSQILVAGELDAERLRLHETSCDLRAVADGVLAAARLRAPETIQLALSAPDELPALRCDEDKLRQVLVNLVENAIKYSPQGGDVTVHLSAHDSRVQIDVRDGGLGVPASDQERIFDKFVRLDPAQSRGVGGSGLGLYITRELIERMGGTISVESAPGGGSLFSVTLPTGA